MPSPRTTDVPIGGRFGRVGALRRPHPAGRRPQPRVAAASRVLALVVLLVTVGSATANPLPFRTPHDCPDGVLPLRLAAFQPAAGDALDVRAAIALGEFALARAILRVERGEGPITLAVLVYAGSLAQRLEVEIATERGVVTWRREVALDPPDAGLLTYVMHPLYVLVPVPDHEWHVAFPQAGPYSLRARRPFGHHMFPDAFCHAETSSWALVVR
jgi:hypothetical protein